MLGVAPATPQLQGICVLPLVVGTYRIASWILSMADERDAPPSSGAPELRLRASESARRAACISRNAS